MNATKPKHGRSPGPKITKSCHTCGEPVTRSPSRMVTHKVVFCPKCVEGGENQKYTGARLMAVEKNQPREDVREALHNGMTQPEAVSEFGLSRQRVNQIAHSIDIEGRVALGSTCRKCGNRTGTKSQICDDCRHIPLKPTPFLCAWCGKPSESKTLHLIKRQVKRTQPPTCSKRCRALLYWSLHAKKDYVGAGINDQIDQLTKEIEGVRARRNALRLEIRNVARSSIPSNNFDLLMDRADLIRQELAGLVEKRSRLRNKIQCNQPQ